MCVSKLEETYFNEQGEIISTLAKETASSYQHSIYIE